MEAIIMGRFTLPRDLYHGKGALENLKTLKGKKAKGKKVKSAAWTLVWIAGVLMMTVCANTRWSRKTKDRPLRSERSVFRSLMAAPSTPKMALKIVKVSRCNYRENVPSYSVALSCPNSYLCYSKSSLGH